MRKVDLRMNEVYKYTTIKKLVETNGNKHRAAQKLQCTTRTINRLIIKYHLYGKEGFTHGNRDRKPMITKDLVEKKRVIELYRTEYSDANFKHFSKLLAENENIHVSSRTLLNWFMMEGVLSPKHVVSPKRITRRN